VRRTLAIVVSLLVPPLGIVFLWTRTRAGVVPKLAGTLALAAVSFAHLHYFFGLRAQLDGTGQRPIFSFDAEELGYEKLERNRAAQKEAPPAPSPLPVEPDPPAPVAAVAGDVPRPAPLDWPRFRGSNMDGRYHGKVITVWPADGLPMLWKQPIGGGYASFVVVSGRAFTIEQRRSQEVVAAYELATGRELWTHGWDAEFRETLGGDGPRATPTWDEGRVYALGATGELKVLEDRTGAVIWERNILDDARASNLTWGMAASPLIVDERVIALPGGPDGGVVAYDKENGTILWKSLDEPQAYTSPMLVTLAGVRQILVVAAERAMGLSVEEGALLWEHPWITNQGINVAQPVLLDESQIFLSAGYDHGAELLSISGDGEGLVVRSLWSSRRMKNKFTTSVLHEGHLYGLDEAILACIDAATGDLRWKGGRYGYGQLLLASGHLIVLTERGELVLVRATPEKHEEIAKFQAIEGKTWNHPAIADGILLVRNGSEMAAFRIAP
jgi:outer membrane protein assembly factor BamB